MKKREVCPNQRFTLIRKGASFLLLFLILFSSSLIMAADNQTTTGEETTSTKTEDAYSCLEDKAGDCSGLTVQELALTIMATPDNVFDDCVKELESREESGNWGNIQDTSLAIIALNHAGKDTQDYEEWLLSKNQTPSDLTWYLQQDSNEAAECHIAYGSEDYSVKIGENKKIDKDAGSCLSRAQSNFWLEINNACYNEKFKIECDKDFIANLIYKNKNSPTIYVLEGTSSAPALGSVDLKTESRCFGDGACDYESSVWATLALLETGHDVEEFVPYIIAMAESNEAYMPSAFIYIMTNYDDYASSLIEEQKLGNFWEADSTAYNKYYDTGLALLSLSGSTAEQVTGAKDWLFFSQDSNGCWKNSIQETAMILWALEGRAGKSEGNTGSSGNGNSVTLCTEANYFCIPSSECSSEEDVGDNYFCSALSETCCTKNSIKLCSEYGGQVCADNKVCTGNSRVSSDSSYCCTGSCEEKASQDDCESNFYECMETCSDSQEPMSGYSCSQGQTCCRTKPTDSSGGSSWWIWLLIILILITLGAIAYVYREQIKLYWFQVKTKFKKDDDTKKSSGSSRPGIPPRPGFPPVRRPRPMPLRPRPISPYKKPNQGLPKKRPYDRRDKSMSDTFQELRDMSK